MTPADSAWVAGNANANYGLVITTTSPLPSYTLNTGVYSEVIVATGGAGANTFAVTAGTVPPGLVVLPNGQVWGQPGVPGTYNFTVTVTNGAATFAKAFTMVVISDLNIATASPLPNGTSGVLYSDLISAAAGTAPYTYSIIAGSLPIGMAFYPNGQIWGVPTAPGVYVFDVSVTDSAGSTSTKAFSLTVL
jgi:hypothetical protein